MKELEDDSDGTDGPCGSGGAGADCDGGGGPLPKLAWSPEYEVAACAPAYGSGKRVGGTARHFDRKCVMDPTPLNDVRAAAADVAADTAGTAVAVPVADSVGAAADIAADARAALASAAADTAIVAADARAALADAAADVRGLTSCSLTSMS